MAREVRVQNNTEEAMVGTEKSMWIPDTICHLERGGEEGRGGALV